MARPAGFTGNELAHMYHLKPWEPVTITGEGPYLTVRRGGPTSACKTQASSCLNSGNVSFLNLEASSGAFGFDLVLPPIHFTWAFKYGFNDGKIRFSV